MSRSSRESQGPELAVIAGSAHPALASEIARALGAPELPVAIERFPDGELSAVVLGPVRGRIAVIVQPTGPPVDEHLVELLALTDACRRAAAGRVVAVVPYFGYARGDRRGGVRGPIMASLAAQLIQVAGVDQIVTLDLHAPQIEGFFHIPVDDLTAFGPLLGAVRDRVPGDVVVVSPDLGRLGLATLFADQLRTTAAVIHKRRTGGREARSLQVVGDVRDRACLIVDDMISTGGTIATAVRALLDAGARPEIFVAATHGLFVAGAAEQLHHRAIKGIWVCDTLPQAGEPDRTVVPVAPLIAAALERIRHVHDVE